MESMSQSFRDGRDSSTTITPNIDRLEANSLRWSTSFSNGTHTAQGIMSTLFSQPALPGFHPMAHDALFERLCGLPTVLHQHGYNTLMTIAHDKSFDNINTMTMNNSIDILLSSDDWDSTEVANIWGIPDHVLFRNSLKWINSLPTNQPFFATILTMSNHPPFVMPEDIPFRPCKANDEREQEVEYADWCIGEFMRAAAYEPWFDSTLFIFVGDHGVWSDDALPLPLSYYKVPLFFYAPAFIEPQLVDGLAQQIDIAPTILHALFPEQAYNASGIDLFSYKRQYAVFTEFTTRKTGIIDDQYFYVHDFTSTRQCLYQYKQVNSQNIIDSLPQTADTMRNYGFAVISKALQRHIDHTLSCD